MLLSLKPAPSLQPFVLGYWFVKDWAGEYEGRPIQTAPHPGAVLSVNIGRPNATADGQLAPPVSLLGLQTSARRWRSWSETYFVMAMLSIMGMMRLFPAIGEDTANRLTELNTHIGDQAAHAISAGIDPSWSPRQIASHLDRWLIKRLEQVKSPPEFSRFKAAHESLRAGQQVLAVANSVGVSRRQLDRWFHTHIGMGPQQLRDLERLQKSIRAVQRRDGDPLAGFSDQAHQIRRWGRRLDTTPAHYSHSQLSPMARYFVASDSAAPAFYL